MTQQHVIAEPRTSRYGKQGHWIDGRRAESTGDGYIDSVSPADRHLVAEIADGSASDLDAALSAAVRAQRAWRDTRLAERSAILRAIAQGIRDNLESLREIELHEAGKLDATMEILASADYFDYYASVVRTLHGETIEQGSANHTYTRHEPYGVIGVITPWNGAMNQGSRSIAPALAAGNAIVVKPAQFTSLSTLALGRIATEAGLPDGLLNVITGRGSTVGTQLVQDSRVGKVSFTGSVAVGQLISRLAAERVMPVTLELGGKSPLIVFADADLDGAAMAVANTTLMGSGQVCSATTRLIVERAAQDAVLERAAAILATKQPGVDFGPIITEPQYEKVQEYLASAVEEGARAITGGHTYSEGAAAEGFYVAPTIYADARPDMRIAREEIFGPVVTALPFDSAEEAIAMANDSDFGLGGAVWSGDVARGIAVAERLETGQVSVNGGLMSNETPFGGYKLSGHGREKGAQAIYEYSQLKTISVALHL